MNRRSFLAGLACSTALVPLGKSASVQIKYPNLYGDLAFGGWAEVVTYEATPEVRALFEDVRRYWHERRLGAEPDA